MKLIGQVKLITGQRPQITTKMRESIIANDWRDAATIDVVAAERKRYDIPDEAVQSSQPFSQAGEYLTVYRWTWYEVTL